MNIFNNLKEYIFYNINEAKKLSHDIDVKRCNINNNLSIINKFLTMLKSPSDINKPQVLKYYGENVQKILIKETEEFVDYLYDNNKLDDINKINAAGNLNINDKELNKTLYDIVYNIKIFLEIELTRYNSNIPRSLRNDSKKILDIIENQTYKNNIDDLNKVINYMNNDTDLNEDEIEKISFYMSDEYQKNLKIQKAKEKHEEYSNTISETITKKDEHIDESINNEKLKSEKHDILNNDDKELIYEINKIIFIKRNELKYLNNEYINALEGNLDFISKNKKYKSDLLLYNLNVLLKKVYNIQDVVDNKTDITLHQLSKYIYLKDKIMLKIQNFYLQYSDLNNNEQVEEIEYKKHIIYLTNNNGNLYFDIDKIDKEYYPTFLKMINDIENGIISNNPSKDGMYTDHLRGISKKKAYKSRIAYISHGDYAFILTMFIKKSDNELYINNHLSNVASKTKDIIKKLKEDLKDPIKKEMIINQNKEIHKNIKQILETKNKTLTLK